MKIFLLRDLGTNVIFFLKKQGKIHALYLKKIKQLIFNELFFNPSSIYKMFKHTKYYFVNRIKPDVYLVFLYQTHVINSCLFKVFNIEFLIL